MRLTLLQMKYFETLARILHYTKASQELNISQPSLSYAMNELELELGAKLFHKENRKVELTVYGERFLPYVRQALATIAEGTRTVRRLSNGEPETVRLGYVHSVASSLVPAIINDLYGQNDENRISFIFSEGNSREVFESLKNGEVDLAICTSRDEGMESIPILRQSIYLAVAADHPLAGRPAVSIDDFIREPQILLDKNSNLRGTLDELFSQREIVPRIAFEVRECNTALQYVALHFGVSVLPYVPAMDDERISVVPIFDDGAEMTRNVYLNWLRGHQLPGAAEKVVDFIEARYKIN